MTRIPLPEILVLSPMGDKTSGVHLADLHWLTIGGWQITIEMEGSDRWVVSGKHQRGGKGVATMGNVHGVDVADALHNARVWAETWEKQENQRLAEGGK